jgi:hypothetical protein
MANEWFYTQNGQPAPSPISAVELKQLASAGQLQPTDLVWQEGMETWKPASSIKGLFPTTKVDSPVSGSGVQNPSVAPRPTRPTKTDEVKPLPRAAEPAGMHPLLVLLLTLLTVGIFGIWYTLSAGSAFTRAAARRSRDSAGRPLGKARHPAGMLLLSLLTLGYYFYYWVYVASKECCEYTDRRDFNPRTETALMLIIPFYSLYVAVYRLPELVKRTQELAGVPTSSALTHTWIYLLPLMLFPLPFLAMLYQDALNQVWLSAP